MERVFPHFRGSRFEIGLLGFVEVDPEWNRKEGPAERMNPMVR